MYDSDNLDSFEIINLSAELKPCFWFNIFTLSANMFTVFNNTLHGSKSINLTSTQPLLGNYVVFLL